MIELTPEAAILFSKAIGILLVAFCALAWAEKEKNK